MNSITSIIQRHLMLSFQMILAVIEQCPDAIWTNRNEKESVWKRVLHVLESVDYWLGDFSDYQFPQFFKGFSAEMEFQNKLSISKTQIIEYAKFIEGKIAIFFHNMSEEKLTTESMKHQKVTYLDIVLSQIRHIQTNVGYCNEKLIGTGCKAVDWIGFNEDSKDAF
jgi:uncharacterized protein YutD